MTTEDQTRRLEAADAALAEQLAKLSAMAEKVNAQSTAYREAITAEQAADAELLALVVERVKPALRALSSQIVSRDHHTGGANGLNPVLVREYHEARGVKLAGGFEEVSEERGNTGTYEGEALYLLTNGIFARNVYSGEWSRWQGAWCRLDAELEPLTLDIVARRYEVPELLEELATKLGEQLKGSAPARTKAALERAAKIGAIAKLAGK
jgi:hypothetical protein